jgi:hypothetical protein
MKSIKVLALIVGAIALLPSASFAQNVAGTSQEANLSSTTVGIGNLVVTDVAQHSITAQKAGRHGDNISGTNQTVNAATTTVGDYNTIVQTAIQKAKNGQKAK